MDYDYGGVEAKEFQREREKLIEDFRGVLAKAQGRRFVWWLLGEGRVFGSTFSSDPAVMAFQEGQRNLALKVMDLLMEIAPEKFAQMQLEYKAQIGRKQKGEI